MWPHMQEKVIMVNYRWQRKTAFFKLPQVKKELAQSLIRLPPVGFIPNLWTYIVIPVACKLKIQSFCHYRAMLSCETHSGRFDHFDRNSLYQFVESNLWRKMHFAGMDKCMDDSCKRRAECFCHSLLLFLSFTKSVVSARHLLHGRKWLSHWV